MAASDLKEGPPDTRSTSPKCSIPPPPSHIPVPTLIPRPRPRPSFSAPHNNHLLRHRATGASFSDVRARHLLVRSRPLLCLRPLLSLSVCPRSATRRSRLALHLFTYLLHPFAPLPCLRQIVISSRSLAPFDCSHYLLTLAIVLPLFRCEVFV